MGSDPEGGGVNQEISICFQNTISHYINLKIWPQMGYKRKKSFFCYLKLDVHFIVNVNIHFIVNRNLGIEKKFFKAGAD